MAVDAVNQAAMAKAVQARPIDSSLPDKVQGDGETAHEPGYHPDMNAQERRAGIPLWLLSIVAVAFILLALWAGQRQLMYFPFGDTRANGATVPLHTDGNQYLVFKSGSGKKTHLILDVTGYFK